MNMCKKTVVTLLAVTMFVGILAGCNKNEPDVSTNAPETEVTTEPESTTDAETTEPEVTTDPENTTDAETTEPESETTKPATEKETTTKKQETTTRKPEPPVTQPPATEPPTEAQQPISEPESQEFVEEYPDINTVGGLYSPIRAGLYYNEVGVLTTYEQIGEGETYFIYSSGGGCETKTKPYSPGNEPVILTDYCTFCGAKIDAENALATKTCKHCGADLTKYGLHRCDYCGKNTDDVNGHNACAYGGCTRWWKNINCPECGVLVPAYTCHTCKN